ncbi:MAG: Maf family protein [Gemmataceae bacterium]
MARRAGRPASRERPSENDAAHLTTLGGREHKLWTETVLAAAGDVQIAWQEKSDVFFRSVPKDEMDAYLATRQWRGCSRAYAIQERTTHSSECGAAA